MNTENLSRGGRRPGAKNRTTVLREIGAERYAEGVLEFLNRVMTGQEVDGVKPDLDDRLAAAKQLVRVAVPVPRPPAVALPLPDGGDLRPGLKTVLRAVSAGELGLAEAEVAIRVLTAARAAAEGETGAASDREIDIFGHTEGF
jgi:hypothetical protein